MESLPELVAGALALALIGGLLVAVMAELYVCAILGNVVGGQVGVVLAIAVFAGFALVDVRVLRPILRRLSRPSTRS